MYSDTNHKSLPSRFFGLCLMYSEYTWKKSTPSAWLMASSCWVSMVGLRNIFWIVRGWTLMRSASHSLVRPCRLSSSLIICPMKICIKKRDCKKYKIPIIFNIKIPKTQYIIPIKHVTQTIFYYSENVAYLWLLRSCIFLNLNNIIPAEFITT